MDYSDFSRVRRQVVKCCQKHCLYSKWEVNDGYLEYDFIKELNEEATDRETLEVPTCIEPSAYILVKMPSPQSMGEYWFDEYEKNVARYKEVSRELVGIEPPDYLIGVENGYVSHLMWCAWD